MNMIAWLAVLLKRGWVRVKFLFRDIAVRFERLAYLARMFNQLRKGEFTEEGFVRSIPCLDGGPPTVLRWVREVRDVTFYLGHRFDRKMAVYIVKECQELMRESYVYYAYMDGGELLRMKRGLYKLAGQLKSAMTPVSISDSVNFLLGRMYSVVRRTAFGENAVDDDDGSEE